MHWNCVSSINWL